MKRRYHLLTFASATCSHLTSVQSFTRTLPPKSPQTPQAKRGAAYAADPGIAPPCSKIVPTTQCRRRCIPTVAQIVLSRHRPSPAQTFPHSQQAAAGSSSTCWLLPYYNSFRNLVGILASTMLIASIFSWRSCAISISS